MTATTATTACTACQRFALAGGVEGCTAGGACTPEHCTCTYTAIHFVDADTNQCACGGEWVYFEPEYTHGCEVAGPPEGIVLDTHGRIVEVER